MVIATALLLTGTVGSGKTTTAERIAERLRSDGVAHAVVDLDAVRQFWPTPDHDRFGFEMELCNLAPLVHNYLSGGAQRLVLAGVCETQRDRARYEEALAVPLSVCRLRVAADILDGRLRRRHIDDADGLCWHLARAVELDQVLDEAAVADLELTVHDMTRDQVADAVLRIIGWTSPSQ